MGNKKYLRKGTNWVEYQEAAPHYKCLYVIAFMVYYLPVMNSPGLKKGDCAPKLAKSFLPTPQLVS